MDSSVSLGSRVKELRTSRELTQSALAEYLAVTPTQISDIENSKTFPSLGRAVMLADFFGVSLDYLAGFSNIRRVPVNEGEIVIIKSDVFMNRVKDLPVETKQRLLGYLDCLENK